MVAVEGLKSEVARQADASERQAEAAEAQAEASVRQVVTATVQTRAIANLADGIWALVQG